MALHMSVMACIPVCIWELLSATLACGADVCQSPRQLPRFDMHCIPRPLYQTQATDVPFAPPASRSSWHRFLFRFPELVFAPAQGLRTYMARPIEMHATIRKQFISSVWPGSHRCSSAGTGSKDRRS
ncbi:hypothetical protein SNOG_16311 [Parastagonospora nodorum SN15]|uniref:Secreted protein n=1 Tax=Phaeosphaeria nodorum (strain SN15 / ATCC MYA-4574 / FGSC 10173) TaxID=321614 RepID=Q0TVY8_PHANO|nr:hypothetical protein SNOG_16311 [Parastagonospora nodorum SN15]EAT76297.1 hypothetical protein SNOG_16311 [Parastagonospora nodorum SN15]